MPRSHQRRPESAPTTLPSATHANRTDNVEPARTEQSTPSPPHTHATNPGTTPLTAPADRVAIGVGLDTSRYGHHASFFGHDLEEVDDELNFVESGASYQAFRAHLDALAAKHGNVHFHFRVDVAGYYADNLLAFLQSLPYAKTISCGDPERNANYKVAIYGHKKCDAVESHACARFALTEKPAAMPTVSADMHLLAAIAGRLESQTRQCTRYVNQLHNLLASTFPDLGLLVSASQRLPTNLATCRCQQMKLTYLCHKKRATYQCHKTTAAPPAGVCGSTSPMSRASSRSSACSSTWARWRT